MSVELDVLRGFTEAHPEIIAERALQQRIDRKFLMPAWNLERTLDCLRCDYHIVRAGEQLIARYESLYFDTPDRQLYEDHRRGRRPRFKIRIRHHLDRQLTFLEIKRKEKNGRTSKFRLDLPFAESELAAEACSFIAESSPISPVCLVPCLSIAFFRITLVGTHINERLTFDCHVEFSAHDRRESLRGVVIAEIKQPHCSNVSTSVRVLRGLGAREEELSKYCLATSRLARVRTHGFKSAFRAVERLSRCEPFLTC